MKKHEIVFPLNETDKIVIALEEPLTEVHCCYDVPIFLYQNDKALLLSTDSLETNMSGLRIQLANALKNELPLHKSITKNIGYLYNEDLQDKPGLAYEKLESRDYWVGNNHKLWSYGLATWLYNDQNGSIILEITPTYPGHFNDDPSIIPYEQWLEQYKPLLIYTLSKKIAESWYEQVDRIATQIEQNIKAIFKKN